MRFWPKTLLNTCDCYFPGKASIKGTLHHPGISFLGECAIYSKASEQGLSNSRVFPEQFSRLCTRPRALRGWASDWARTVGSTGCSESFRGLLLSLLVQTPSQSPLLLTFRRSLWGACNTSSLIYIQMRNRSFKFPVTCPVWAGYLESSQQLRAKRAWPGVALPSLPEVQWGPALQPTERWIANSSLWTPRHKCRAR